MKYIFSCCIALVSLAGYSQNNLYFCAAVQNNECVLNNTKFFSSPDSTYMPVCMMYRNENGLSTTKLYFVVNKIDEQGKEVFFATFDQDVQAEWVWAYKTGNFTVPGKYTVKVLSQTELPLLVKTFEIFKP